MPKAARRFQLEAEITGSLEHPGIVPIHGMGRDASGQAFYVMKFIRGETLQVAINRFFQNLPTTGRPSRALGFRKLLNHFLATCQTIAYAHSKGVIHRDIKPDNIMLGKYGETLVVDWGLARVLENPQQADFEQKDAVGVESVMDLSPTHDSSKTAMGQALGTPAFMSPEQANGQLDLVDERTDVYSLGATLYVILTGRKPFQGNIATVMAAVRAGRFEPPRAVRVRCTPSRWKPCA